MFCHKKGNFNTAFRNIITGDRLDLICKFLHFANNETINNSENPEKLFKMFLVLSNLNYTFQELYHPKQDILIDESPNTLARMLSFKQCLPLRASKFGIKTRTHC
jgi:hypothetical protein